MTDSAQLFHGIHDTPVYTDFLFRKPLRLWVAAPAALGLTLTFIFTVRLLDSGHARAVLFSALTTLASKGTPRASSCCAACCIVSQSLWEPMMIPTRGWLMRG